MKKKLLEKVLLDKTEEIKNYSYDELLNLVNNVKCFSVKYENHEFHFEVQVFKHENGLDVMVDCSMRRLIFLFIGKHKYFYKDKGGLVVDYDGKKFWERN